MSALVPDPLTPAERRRSPGERHLRAHCDLLMVMAGADLPPPIALTWNTYRATVTAQVMGEDFRPWLWVLKAPELETYLHESRTHVTATGTLRYTGHHLTLVAVLETGDNPLSLADLQTDQPRAEL